MSFTLWAFSKSQRVKDTNLYIIAFSHSCDETWPLKPIPNSFKVQCFIMHSFLSNYHMFILACTCILNCSKGFGIMYP